jgi:hypothetical protein
MYPGHVCLDISPLYGPRVVESGKVAAVELTCSFSHNVSELNQLDVKCYFQVAIPLYSTFVHNTQRRTIPCTQNPPLYITLYTEHCTAKYLVNRTLI